MRRVVVDFFLCKRGGEAGKKGFSAYEKKAWRKIWCGISLTVVVTDTELRGLH